LKILALDVDGVLADTYTPFCRLLSEKVGRQVEKSDLTLYGIGAAFGIPQQDIREMLGSIWADWSKISPLEEDIHATFDNLRELFSVVIATARSAETIHHVRSWLQHINLKYDEFYPVTRPADKVNLKFDVLVDDYIRNVEDAVNAGRTGILYAQPYNNRLKLPERALKVNSLAEICQLAQAGRI
jgi:uncharacterized HAD superfamily protein